jgi:hypothetical protein
MEITMTNFKIQAIALAIFIFLLCGARASSAQSCSAFPLPVGSIFAGQTVNSAIGIDFSICAAAARFTATFKYLETFDAVLNFGTPEIGGTAGAGTSFSSQICARKFARSISSRLRPGGNR